MVLEIVYRVWQLTFGCQMSLLKHMLHHWTEFVKLKLSRAQMVITVCVRVEM